jgi:HDOD domain
LLNTGVLEFRADQDRFAERLVFQPKLVDDLPDVPVMPETLLLMELGIHEFAVDLAAMSQLVLSDLGATLQILRLAARECGEARPERMEDCISILGPQACLKAAARRSIGSGIQCRVVFEAWAHAREIAQVFRVLAEETHGKIRPEEAYLAGLCHVLGFLPEMLSWDRPAYCGRGWGVGLKLAERWSLPFCVAEFFAEMQLSRGGARWGDLARKAHRIVRRSPLGCPLFDGESPQVYSRV